MSETEREGRVLTRRTRKALSRYRIDIDVCWIDKIRRAVTRRVRRGTNFDGISIRIRGSEKHSPKTEGT